MRKYTLLALLTGLLAIAPLSRADDALYKSLGGKKAITAVVDDFVGRCASDTRINSFFKATAADPKRLANFKKNLIDQLTGPVKWTQSVRAMVAARFNIEHEAGISLGADGDGKIYPGLLRHVARVYALRVSKITR